MNEHDKNAFKTSTAWSCKKIELNDKVLEFAVGLTKDDEQFRIIDEFGDTYRFPPNIYCTLDYYRYVRHRIENAFDIVESFNDLCGPKDAPAPIGNYNIPKKNISHQFRHELMIRELF